MNIKRIYRSDYPSIQANMLQAEESGRFANAWRVDGDDVLMLGEWNAHPTTLIIGRKDVEYFHPMDERFSPKLIYQLWRASRF